MITTLLPSSSANVDANANQQQFVGIFVRNGYGSIEALDKGEAVQNNADHAHLKKMERRMR